MSHEETKFWFPAKSFGWGWGLPVRWQGWVVLLSYIGLFVGAAKFFRDRNDVEGLLWFFGILTVAFVIIVAVKGERPLKWRWGRD